MTSHDSLFPWFDTGYILMRQSLAPEVVPSFSCCAGRARRCLRQSYVLAGFAASFFFVVFYGPLYLAVTCSVLVCLRSICVDFLLGGDFWIYFRVQRFLVRQWIHDSSSLRRLFTRILRSILVLLSFVSVYSTLLGSTVDTNFASVYGEFHVFLRGGLRILRSILDSQVYPPVACSWRRLWST